MKNDELLLKQYKEILFGNQEEKVIDLDKKFRLKFNYQVYPFSQVLQESENFLPPKRWSYYQIVFLTNGTGEVTAGAFKFNAKKNTLIVLPARIISSSRNWSQDAEGWVLIFSLDFFLEQDIPYHHLLNKKILNRSVRPYIELNSEQSDQIMQIIYAINDEKKADLEFSNERVALKIIELLILSQRFYSKAGLLQKSEPYNELMWRFAELLEKNFTRERSVGFYAKKLHIHPNYLNAIVKSQTGLSTKETIRNRVILEAKYLLHSTQLTIREIGYELGFEDPNYFSLFFSRAEKVPPLGYRTSFFENS